MKLSKKILSILLALVMLTTSVSSVLYASAAEDSYKTDAIGYSDVQSADLEQLVRDLLGEYSDGETLIQFLNSVVADTIGGNLVFDENGRQLLKGVSDEISAGADSSIDEAYKKYIPSGDYIVSFGNEQLVELLNTQKVMGVPIMQLRYVQNLDTLVSTQILADNSDVMKMAASSLQTMFPNVEPTYESIISCLIPILSAFNFGEIMANMSNIGAALGLASPSAFAVMAGINSEEYLTTINESLISNGYLGSPVVPLITLDDAAKAELEGFVAMENAGTSLADIAEAGFDWTNYVGDASKLDLANAFIKIALGDADKLGALAADENVGPALVNILCDLLNDVKAKPVSTLLGKISDAKALSAIVDFAMNLLNGFDSTYMSYDMYFTDNIKVDGKGNTAFYMTIVDGEYTYNGPRAMDQYLPMIAAGLDFLSNIDNVIEANNGDLIKTLFVDKLPQLSNLIDSAISYTKDGKENPGMVIYLLENYKEYLMAQNAVLSNDVLISIAQAAIEKAQEKIEEKQVEIGIWQGYLTQVESAENAARLAKAKELGIFDAGVSAYDESALDTAIETKIAALEEEIAVLTQTIAEDEAAVEAAGEDAATAQENYDVYEAKINEVLDNTDFLDAIIAVLEAQDGSGIDALDDYSDWFDGLFGAGQTAALKALLADNYADYYDADNEEVLFDDFFETFVLGEDGLNLNGMLDELFALAEESAATLTTAQGQLDKDTKAKNRKVTEYDKLVAGTVKEEIVAAGNGVTIHINDNTLDVEGDFTKEDISGKISAIQNGEIAGFNATIAAEEEKITAYNADKQEKEAVTASFDLEAIAAEQKALHELAASAMTFLGGDSDKNIKSLYDYFNDGQFIEMIAAPDRVAALRGIIDEVITVFGPKLPVFLGEDITLNDNYLDQIWAVENILFGDDGVISTLLADFINDPVLCVVKRIAPLASIVDYVYEAGLFAEIIGQYLPVAHAVSGIFGSEKDGFIKEWNTPYADGTAAHHYLNALLSLLPKIVAIYDEANDVEAIKAFIEPYEDIIELGLGLLTKEFYDAIMKDGVVATVLDLDRLDKIWAFAYAQLEASDIDNKDLILPFADAVYHELFDTFYEDLRDDPAQALSTRAEMISQLVQLIAVMETDFDLSEYEDIINISFFKGYIAMVPADYQSLLPQGITGIFTMLVRSLLFGEQYIITENTKNSFKQGDYFYFKPTASGKYIFTFSDIEGELEDVYFDGVSVPLNKLNETDESSYLYMDLNANEVYELCIDSDTCSRAGVLIYCEDHEHILADAVTVDATCEAAGSITGVCDLCGQTITETLPALGHKPSEETKVNEKAATCTEDGSYDLVVFCTVCQKQLSKVTIQTAILGHDWGEWTQTTAPSCNAEGVETRVCARDASHVETRAVAKIGHTQAAAVKENVVAATCEAAGSYDSVIKCSVCGAELSREKMSIPATGHSPAAAVKENEVAATCTAAGSYDSVTKCATCGKELSREKVSVDALGHAYESIETKATGTKCGYTTHTCSRCGDSFTDTYTAPTGKIGGLKCKTRTANAQTIIWNKVSTATGYQVQISSKDGKKWDKTVTIKNNKTVSTTFKSLAAGNAYKFRARFYITAADGKNYFSPWSGTLTSPTLPAGVNLTKVAAGSKSFTANWKKNTAVGGYQVQYSLKANFSGAKSVTVKSNKTLKTTVKKLNAKKVYYVRIRTYKTISKVNYYSAWSKVLKVKTK